MYNRTFWGLALIGALLISPTMVSAQKQKPADRGPWEISVFAGGFNDEYEFDPDGSRIFIDPDRNVLFGGFFGYHFGSGLYVGLDGRFVPLDMRPAAGGVTDLNAFFYSAQLGYTLPLHEKVDLFGAAGLSMANWRPENADSEMDMGFNYGGGLRVYLKENIALIGDVRVHQMPEALTETSLAVTNLIAKETFWGWSITGGISYFFGSKDSDGDGVKDGDDACPDTPEGVEVDARGCPVDSDRDGVADYMDDCPNTPAGARVNSRGCPTDADNDGVYDGIDRCPNTPSGATVNDQGCPTDSDNDGVYDGLDRCPNTRRGTEVDRNGCPVPEPEPEPEPEPVTYTFRDVNFEFDSARLTSAGEALLREIGQTLAGIDNVRVEVHGHTDSVGTEEYNMTLSARRARAVRDFLVENFRALTAGQFTVRDFGESQPIASNDTADGRARNRRVEIKVGG